MLKGVLRSRGLKHWLPCLALIGVLALHTTLPASAGTIRVSSGAAPVGCVLLEALGSEALARIGYKLELTKRPSTRSLREANHGEFDGEGFRIGGLSAAFPNLIQVPEVMHHVDFVAFTVGERQPVVTRADLAAFRTVHIRGWEIFERLTAGLTGAQKVKDAEGMFRILDRGRADVALYTRIDGTALVRKLGFPHIRASKKAIRSADLFLYLHRRHEGLVPRVSEALRDMKEDGSFARIRARVLDQHLGPS